MIKIKVDFGKKNNFGGGDSSRLFNVFDRLFQ